MSKIEINPERLKGLLEMRKLNQKELAKAIQVDVTTVNRWMTGRVTKLRGDIFSKLCKELSARKSDLCGEGPLPDAPPECEPPSKDPVSFEIDTACRNALALVARRYGVKQREIVEIAPLLFLIIAEQSLAERESALVDLGSRLSDAENATPAHLRNRFRFPHDEDDLDLATREKRSIAARDLFASQVGYREHASEAANPFAHFLSNLLKATDAPHEPIGRESIRWARGDEPRYRIGLDELSELMGGDKGASRKILHGIVALAEMPGDLRRATPEKRAAWVKEKSVEDLKEFSAALADMSWEVTAKDLNALKKTEQEEEF